MKFCFGEKRRGLNHEEYEEHEGARIYLVYGEKTKDNLNHEEHEEHEEARRRELLFEESQIAFGLLWSP